MRVLATVMLMVSLLAMSVTVAGADIARPPCHSQIRADNMCHAPALPGGKAEAVKKPGSCFTCLLPVEGGDGPEPLGTQIPASFEMVVLADARRTVPWRPPRA